MEGRTQCRQFVGATFLNARSLITRGSAQKSPDLQMQDGAGRKILLRRGFGGQVTRKNKEKDTLYLFSRRLGVGEGGLGGGAAGYWHAVRRAGDVGQSDLVAERD